MEQGKVDIRSLDYNEVSALLSGLGAPAYRAAQVFAWIHQKAATSFADMTDIPKALRAALERVCEFSVFESAGQLRSQKDDTIKYLFHAGKHTIIETVKMRHSYGASVCVSSQAGCRMGCAFCASGMSGLDRNLTAGEMTAQVYKAAKSEPVIGKGVSRVVIMGCGEPLDNYANTIKFINILTDPRGTGLGARHITLSTCGPVPKIYDLARENGGKGLQITLAVSLHAPNDEIRGQLMPVNNKYPMADLLKACADYAAITKRRVTYEYALMGGVNDAPGHAAELAEKLKNTLCHVNIIPMNPVDGAPFVKSGSAASFAEQLERRGVTATLRRSLGADIEGACGQLRKKYLYD